MKRLLDSVVIQTFKDFEVVISDDSNDESVQELIKKYGNKFPIVYHKNDPAMGTPENWNEAIRKARGKWIKLMHDDDWFANKNSLYTFYNVTIAHPGCAFFFSAYNNVDESTKTSERVTPGIVGKYLLKSSPLHLFKKQYIGNPSCTLVKRELDVWYDNRLKWVVDFEYYIRCLKKAKSFFYIDEVLINVGLNDEQVTKYTFRKPNIEIPENHLLLEKLGFGILKNIFVYDYYWRMVRNLGIRNKADYEKFAEREVPKPLADMISFQSKIADKLLSVGPVSKMFMLLSYGSFRKK